MATIQDSTIAIIPARGGSKGVPGKNIKELGGHPLLAYSIAAGQLSAAVDRVLVSTDTEAIADIARRYGAEAPFLRPPEFSGDRSPDAEFLLHAMNWLQEHEGAVPRFWVLLRPTTPLRDPEQITAAVQQYRENPEIADSLRSGHAAAESPFKWFRRSEGGQFIGLTEDRFDPDYYNRPRQEFPEVYIPDGYVDIVRAEVTLESGTAFGRSIYGFVSPVCREVDTIEDFQYLEYEIEQGQSVLREHLSRCR